MDGDIYSNNASIHDSNLKEMIHLDTLVTIYGYECKALKLIYENSTSTYYYSEDIKVDSKSFSNHAYADWNQILKEMNGSIPLQFVTEFESSYYIAHPELVEKFDFVDVDFNPKAYLKSYKSNNDVIFKRITSAFKSIYDTEKGKISSLEATGEAKKGLLSMPINLKLKDPSNMKITISFNGINFYVVENSEIGWQYNPMEDKVITTNSTHKNRGKGELISGFSPMLKPNWSDFEIIHIQELNNIYRIVTKNNRNKKVFYISKRDYSINKWADSESYFVIDKYNDFDGIPFPNNLKQFNYFSDEPVFESTFLDVTFNVEMNDSIFEIPENLKSKIIVKEETISHTEYFNEAESYLKEEKYNEAIDSYKKAISLDNTNKLYFNQLGVAMQRNGDQYGAISAFTRATEIDPDYYVAMHNLGHLKLKLGDYRKAIIDISKAIESNNTKPLYYSNRGLCYYNLESYDTALTDFNRSIELDSSFQVGYWNVAMSHFQLEEYDEAINNFGKSIALRKNNSEAYNYRGICYYNLEKFDLALEDFKNAVKSDKPLVNYYRNLGETYSELEQTRKAINSFKKAIEIDSSFSEGYNLIGLEYLNESSYNAAITAFDEAILISPNEATYYDNRAFAKDGKMDFIGAIDDYSQSISLYPSDPHIYYLRGAAKINVNNKNDACNDFKKAVEMGSEEAKESLKEHCASRN